MSAATPARRAAFEVLRRVFEHEAWADRTFPAAAERHSLEGRERAQAQALAYGAVQRRGTTDHFIGLLSKRGTEGLDAPLVAALRLGLYEVLYSEGAEYAAVDGAVELAKGGMRSGGQRRAAGAAGLVNAVLRRAATEREALLGSLSDDSAQDAAVAHSVPAWLARMWWEELGAAEARSLLRAINEPAETAMRANTLRANPDALRAELDAAGEPLKGSDPSHDAHDYAGSESEALLHPPEAIVWGGPLGAAALRALEDGRMFAQSRGAQAVVEALDPKPGERVLDLCAGPGVKTVALAARVGVGGEVVAVERDPGRARQIEDMAARAGAKNVRVEATDAAGAGGDIGQGYDRVLVDPPCSGLGTLASRPDARWRRDPDAPARLARVQAAILDAGVGALRPGGTIVYSTCTISRTENEDVVDAALDVNADLDLERHLDTRPDRDGTDGFYIAQIGKARSGG
ncbi:MAG TPA: transcription antitermination factor NusB [Solirubrobacterales bacterium]|nr:transcription antitermination factor NusB [Solirubrobacterales bacterium]